MTTERRIFRRIATDRNEWRSEDGNWVIEKAYRNGPRGGRPVEWALFRVADGRLWFVASEHRLRDLWAHVS